MFNAPLLFHKYNIVTSLLYADRPVLSTLEAVADECFEFQQWSDGNKENPRTITVTANTNLTAEFNKVRYTVTGEPSTGGKVQIRKQ